MIQLRYLILIAVLPFASALYAQDNCSDEEVKLLLSPTQTQAAVQALHASGEAHGRVYFYDTPALDLLSQGMILRLREGAKLDLTTKFRPLFGEKLGDPSTGLDRYECEIDLNNGIEKPSYSLHSEYTPTTPPLTGEELFKLLSDDQKQLLKDSKVKIDWKRIKRIADIQSTSWKTAAQPQLGKLGMELWQWPNSSILEISVKVTPAQGQATYVELKKLAKSSGLALSTVQSPKTSVALKKIAAAQHQ
jgi:hypothetical protein